MIKTTVTVKDYTPGLLKDIQAQAMRFVSVGGQEIKAQASIRCPYKTGNLRSSIITESFVENGKPTSETGPTAKHAVYMEYGTGIYAESNNWVGQRTRKIPWTYKDEQGNFWTTYGNVAQPFMEPGFQAAIPRIEKLKQTIMGDL